MIFNDTSNTIHQRVRAGLSLVEILIALTMTLIVLGAMMSAFQYASAEMQNGRATLEMANRVRVAENLLRRDLANLTVEPRPYIDKTIPNGYFEYIEGPRRDLQFPFGVDEDEDGVPLGLDANDNSPAIPSVIDRQTLLNSFVGQENSYLGDVDDILAFTSRSRAGEAFRGRFYEPPGGGVFAGGTTTNIESSYAEIVWWTQFSDQDQDQEVDYEDSVSVFRRVLLINPDLPPQTGLSQAEALSWQGASDVSVRMEVSGGLYSLIPNSLEDLANRRNRYTRDPGAPVGGRFPYPLSRGLLLGTISGSIDATGMLVPDFRPILSNVAAFDVRVFSPDCLVGEVLGVSIGPSDPGFDNTDGDGDGIPFT